MLFVGEPTVQISDIGVQVIWGSFGDQEFLLLLLPGFLWLLAIQRLAGFIESLRLLWLRLDFAYGGALFAAGQLVHYIDVAA